MKVAVFADNGIADWHVSIFDKLPNVTFFISDRNKHTLSTDKVYKLSSIENIKTALKNPLPSYKRLKNNNFDKKLDFHFFTLEKLALEGFFEYVIVLSDRSLYTMASLKEKYNNFKLIYWFPANIPFQDIFDDRSFFIRKYAFDKVDKFISITKTAKETLLYEGIDNERVDAIYPGIVNTDIFFPKNKEDSKKILGFPKDRIELIFVGKITTWKGVYTLLYALKILKNKYNIHLHILGRGAQKERLIKLSKELDITSNLTFHGFVDYFKLNDFYNSCDIFLLPSLPTINWTEQFGFVVAEAMACGLPAIVSKSGALAEVVNYENDLLFTPACYEDLILKIEKLINDKVLYKELSDKCYERSIEEYSSEINTNKIISCLESI